MKIIISKQTERHLPLRDLAPLPSQLYPMRIIKRKFPQMRGNDFINPRLWN